MSCGADGFSMIPSLGEFTPVNESDFLEAENTRSSGGDSCNFEEFQRFESMFSKFVTVVREFFLPPERLRFALVPERSMLSSLGIGNSGTWLMMLYFAGCPNCSKVLREVNDLKSVLQMHASPVTEASFFFSDHLLIQNFTRSRYHDGGLSLKPVKPVLLDYNG